MSQNKYILYKYTLSKSFTLEDENINYAVMC